jgi:dienelactone hydrolase
LWFEQTKWIADGLVVPRALTRDWSLPFFVLDHISAYRSSAYLNAPLSTQQSTYPVVIISHGWSSTRTLHTDLAEELASQGYFVVGMEHTYGSLATVLGDEEADVQYLDYDALPRRAVTPNYLEFANLLVETYASDIIAAIDTLEALNQASGALNQRLDLSSIQVVGHSTGGGAAVKAAIDDPRITSVLGMDAWVEPLTASDLSAGLSTRALYLRSNGWETGENNEYLYQLLQTSSNASPLYQIDGTTHYDFAMVYMYTPLTRVLGITGSLEFGYLNTMLDTLVLEFLAADGEYQIDTNQWSEVREIRLS